MELLSSIKVVLLDSILEVLGLLVVLFLFLAVAPWRMTAAIKALVEPRPLEATSEEFAGRPESLHGVRLCTQAARRPLFGWATGMELGARMWFRVRAGAFKELECGRRRGLFILWPVSHCLA